MDYLRSVYGDTPDGAIVITTYVPSITVRHFSSIEEAAGYADALDASGEFKGIYCTGATVKPVAGGKRGEAADAHALYYLAIDMDVWHPVAHKAANLPRSLADCRDLIAALSFPEPTRWIDSGYGFYPQWQYPEPITVQDWEELQAQYNELKAYISRVALDRFGWKVDPTFDLARVWRLPGTTNRKVADDERPCFVLEEAGGFTSLDDLLKLTLSGQGEQAKQEPESGGQTFDPGAGSYKLGDRPYSQADAEAYVEKWALKPLRESLNGDQNNQINRSALVVAHFATFWPLEVREHLLLNALPEEYKPFQESARRTIRSAFEAFDRFRAAGDLDNGWLAYAPAPDAAPAAERKSRRVDLAAFLDGTYVPPVPSVGMSRSDGKMLIYPERWHTVIGPNGTGKSFFALAHAIAEMKQGHTVAYAHFEESTPGGTLTRLRAMAPDLGPEEIMRLFVWLDCSTRWKDVSEWSAEMQEIKPSFVILDGINRACTQHGWDPIAVSSVGEYGGRFVTPALMTGAAVMSLGHPPKARGRETERHGFGSTAWLDDLEGVGFRLIPSKKRIKEGAHGYAMLYSVKDRYGQVEAGLEPADGKDMDGWYTVGPFWVDSTTAGRSTYGIKPTETNEEGNKKDTLDVLGESIVSVLMNNVAQDGAFGSLKALAGMLREAGKQFRESDLSPAVDRLHRRGTLDSPPVAPRKSRPGALSLTATASREGLGDEEI